MRTSAGSGNFIRLAGGLVVVAGVAVVVVAGVAVVVVAEVVVVVGVAGAVG